MALRTTRQMIEVLAAGSGKGRVTKQGVSVLAAGTGGVRVVRQMVEALVGDVSANVYSASATSLLALTEATGGASNTQSCCDEHDSILSRGLSSPRRPVRDCRC